MQYQIVVCAIQVFDTLTFFQCKLDRLQVKDVWNTVDDRITGQFYFRL